MDLTVFSNDEPRIQDLRLAEMLDFDRARDIRKLIERNVEELERYGALRHHVATPPGGGPAANEYWLNEEQAVLLCMKSATPRAADCREELIALFKAWRGGKLAPRSVGEITLESIGAVVRAEVDPIRREIADVRGNVAFLAKRVDDIVPKRDFLKEPRQQFCYVALRRYDRDCPCCREVKVVDQSGNRLDDAHYEHFNGREKNRPEDGWITCAKCNYRLRDDPEFKEASRIHFRVFQDYRKQLFAGQRHRLLSRGGDSGQGELGLPVPRRS